MQIRSIWRATSPGPCRIRPVAAGEWAKARRASGRPGLEHVETAFGGEAPGRRRPCRSGRKLQAGSDDLCI